MVRATIELEPDQYERLKQQAEAERKSLAAKVREAVDLYLRQEQPSPRTAGIKPGKSISEVAGRYVPLPSAEQDEVKAHDRWWTDTIR